LSRRSVVVLLLCLACGEAAAHAFLDRALPAVGSVTPQAPAEIRLIFTQKLEPAFSTLRVFDAAGKRVDKNDKQVDASVMRVSVPPLQDGTYRVVWRALSVDTHVTEGDYTFQIGK